MPLYLHASQKLALYLSKHNPVGIVLLIENPDQKEWAHTRRRTATSLWQYGPLLCCVDGAHLDFAAMSQLRCTTAGEHAAMVM